MQCKYPHIILYRKIEIYEISFSYKSIVIIVTINLSKHLEIIQDLKIYQSKYPHIRLYRKIEIYEISFSYKSFVIIVTINLSKHLEMIQDLKIYQSSIYINSIIYFNSSIYINSLYVNNSTGCPAMLLPFLFCAFLGFQGS